MGQVHAIVLGVCFLLIAALAMLVWRTVTTGARTRWLLWGALAWGVSVAVKVGIALLCNKPLLAALDAAVPKIAYIVLGALWIGLLTGLTEVLLGYALARLLKYHSFEQGTGFGLGFGVVEAVLLGLGPLLLALALMAGARHEHLQGQLQGLTWLAVACGTIERAMTMILHVACGVMIVRALTGARLRACSTPHSRETPPLRARSWLWAAFGFKSAIDAVAGAHHLSGAVKAWPCWALELSFVPFVVIAAIIVRRAKRSWPTGHVLPEPPR